MRLIDADALLKDINDYPYGYRGMIKDTIARQPTVDIDAITESHEEIGYDKGFRDGYAQATSEVRPGHWNERYDTKYHFECSECKYLHQYRDNYCPNCGAKMNKDEWEEPEINPCRGCVDYDGRGGCKSNGGCGAKMDEVEDDNA